MPYNQRNNQFVKGNFWGTQYLASWSCAVPLLDYFSCAYVNTLVYADKPETRRFFETYIRRIIADMRSEVLQEVAQNWEFIRASQLWRTRARNNF